MATKTLVPVEEYLRIPPERPDCDYVDGEIMERNVGEYLHAFTQGRLYELLLALRTALGIQFVPEIRIQIGPTRFRVADLAVWRKGAEIGIRVPISPPFLVIEILSPEDRIARLVPRIHDYLDAGVEWVWVIDPYDRTALVYSKQDPTGSAATVLRTENPAIEIPLESVLSAQE